MHLCQVKPQTALSAYVCTETGFGLAETQAYIWKIVTKFALHYRFYIEHYLLWGFIGVHLQRSCYGNKSSNPFDHRLFASTL